MIDISRHQRVDGFDRKAAGIHRRCCHPHPASPRIRRSCGQESGLQKMSTGLKPSLITGIHRRLSSALCRQCGRQYLHDPGPCPAWWAVSLPTCSLCWRLWAPTVTIASQEYRGGEGQFSLIQMPAVEKLPEDAIISVFHIPYTQEHEYVQTYRIARRPADGCTRSSTRASAFCLKDRRPGRSRRSHHHLRRTGHDDPPCGQDRSSSLWQAFWNAETLQSALAVLKAEVRDITVPMEEEGMSNEYRRSWRNLLL